MYQKAALSYQEGTCGGKKRVNTHNQGWGRRGRGSKVKPIEEKNRSMFENSMLEREGEE